MFKCKVCVTPNSIQDGMKNKTFNMNFNGMLFIMSEGQHCFWMKNCITNLDIIFIEDDVITKIHHNCTPCKTKDCENYCGEGDMILEVQGGTCKKLGIKSGDTIVHYD